MDDLECAPVSYEDCDREAVEVPYLDTEEVCEDVEFEECVDAEVQVRAGEVYVRCLDNYNLPFIPPRFQ